MNPRTHAWVAWILIGGLGLLASPPARAGEDAGSRSVFATGAGVRALALGGAYAAIADDATAAIWNAGGLGFVERKELQISTTDLYGLGFREDYAGFVLPNWRWGAAALSVRHFRVEGIERRDERNVLLDSDLVDSELEVGVSYGRRVRESWGIGGTLKLQRQALAEWGANALGADAGVQFRPGVALDKQADLWRNLVLGLSWRNAIEPSLRLEDERVADPNVIRFGMASRIPLGGSGWLLATADVERSRDMAARIHAGFEARLQPSLALRVGLNDGELTAGSGITWKSMSLNYGFEDRALGTSHRLGLAWTFGPTTEQSRLATVTAEEERLRGRLAEAFDRRLSEETGTLLAEAEQTFAQGRYEEVLGQLAVVSTLSPDRADVKHLEARSWVQLARQREEEQDFTEAALYYGRVLALFPGDSSAVAAVQRCGRESSLRAVRSDTLRAWFEEALDAFTTGDLAPARAGFSRILRMEPKDADAASMLARTEQAIGSRLGALENRIERAIDLRLFSEAQQGIDEIRRLDPAHPSRKRLEAALARARPESREAARDSSPPGGARAQAATPSEKTTPQRQRELEEFYDRGVREYGAGRAANALRFWEMAYAIDPGYKQLKEYLKKEYLIQGMDAFAAGRLNDAIAFWEKAEEIDPQDEKPRGYLERARAQLSRTREIESHGR